MFQSLFYWMLVLNMSVGEGGNPVSMFQSLFYWMLVLNTWEGINIIAFMIVSILVLLDVGLKPSYQIRILAIGLIVSILVLLDVGLKRWSGPGSLRRWLVSILVLLDVGLKPFPPDLDNDTIPEFQSLFYWMLVLNHTNISLPFPRDCFNPCFTGCWS